MFLEGYFVFVLLTIVCLGTKMVSEFLILDTLDLLTAQIMAISRVDNPCFNLVIISSLFLELSFFILVMYNKLVFNLYPALHGLDKRAFALKSPFDRCV